MKRKRTRRVFSEAQKLEVVRQLLSGEHTTKDIAQSIGVRPEQIYKWKQSYKDHLGVSETWPPATVSPPKKQRKKAKRKANKPVAQLPLSAMEFPEWVYDLKASNETTENVVRTGINHASSRPSYSPSNEGYDLVRWFETAVRAHEMLGASDPESRDEIIETYEKAKAALYLYLIKVENDL